MIQNVQDYHISHFFIITPIPAMEDIEILSRIRYDHKGCKLSYKMQHPEKDNYVCTVTFDHDGVISLQTQEQDITQHFAVQKAASSMVDLLKQVAPRLQPMSN